MHVIVKRIFSKGVIIIIVAAILLSATVYVWQTYLMDTSTVEQVFRVEQGDTLHTIANKLKQEGLIKFRTGFYFSYYVFGRGKPITPGGYKLQPSMSLRDILYTFEEKPWARYITIPPNISKEKIAQIFADALSWDELDRQFFATTYGGMQWQRYHDYMEKIFSTTYEWKKTKTETFLTLSALYYDDQYDFFKNLYVPGTYEIPIDASRAQVAGVLIEYFVKQYPDEEASLTRFLDSDSMDNVANLIEKEMVLMPDIVAIPPQDIVVKRVDGASYLQFTTSYWNKGRGPLELIADPKTKDLPGDLDRKVYQRIYQLDGDYTERLAGVFLWHSPHRHYHFTDFAVYTLEPVEIDSAEYAEKQSLKSTFCVRDSEPVDLTHPGANKSASYKVCGKERQGISPGWADSYYYTYVDQKFDVSNAPKGTYRLSIKINPKDRFDEITKDNNIGEVLIKLDVKNGKVEVLEEKQYGF